MSASSSRGRTLKSLITTAVVLTLAGGVLAFPAQASAQTSCADLPGLRIPASEIGLPTTGAEVTAAQVMPASATAGEYCQVDAAIHPVDPAAPDIRMRVALPTGWNGNALMFGGGGYDGTIPDVTGNVPFGPADQPRPLARGYATFGSDSGHQANQGQLPTASLDGSFGMNDEALRNFASDALKKTRDTAVFVIRVHYGASPGRSFFAGGSTGGREALAVTQRWPHDFNGVISAYPAWNAATLDLFFGYAAQLFSQPGAFPDPAQQTLLYRSVINACDGNDGVRDGVISNEAGCHFDPRTLQCPPRATDPESCLNDQQIRAISTLSARLHLSYPVASGEKSYPGFPYLSGADMTAPILGMGTTPPANPMPPTSGYGVQFWNQWAKYFITRDPAQNSLDINPRRPGEWQQRISELTALQDINNPDLSEFAAAGGKLLLLHGTADELVSHRSTIDYFERVQETMGRPATEQFARFYLIPGADHANFKAAFAAGWDSLTALENWTEQGRAPVNPVVTDTNATAGGRTRPLCEYPTWPRYTGGDPNTATSFTCVK